MADREFELRD